MARTLQLQISATLYSPLNYSLTLRSASLNRFQEGFFQEGFLVERNRESLTKVAVVGATVLASD